MYFWENHQQSVVLNGRFLPCTKVNAEIVLFLIYIMDMPNSLLSKLKLFADNTSLFSTVHDITASTVNLYYDLSKNSEWEMNFNLDPCK